MPYTYLKSRLRSQGRTTDKTFICGGITWCHIQIILRELFLLVRGFAKHHWYKNISHRSTKDNIYFPCLVSYKYVTRCSFTAPGRGDPHGTKSPARMRGAAICRSTSTWRGALWRHWRQNIVWWCIYSCRQARTNIISDYDDNVYNSNIYHHHHHFSCLYWSK